MAVGAHPIALGGEVLRRRIYAPLAYAPARDTAVVPVVHGECMALATWFPLAWRRGQDGPQFVAVRALLDDQAAQVPASRTVLPLLLHGYPFVYADPAAAGAETPKLLDDVFADAPGDAGATITSVNHKLTRATTSRFRALDRFAAELPVTRAIGAALADAGCLTGWPLRFDIAGRTVAIDDLLVVRGEAFAGGDFAQMLQRFGAPCAEMLSLHRLSLFRAGALLAQARLALAEPAADAPAAPVAVPA
jgi:hypothetical protein